MCNAVVLAALHTDLVAWGNLCCENFCWATCGGDSHCRKCVEGIIPKHVIQHWVTRFCRVFPPGSSNEWWHFLCALNIHSASCFANYIAHNSVMLATPNKPLAHLSSFHAVFYLVYPKAHWPHTLIRYALIGTKTPPITHPTYTPFTLTGDNSAMLIWLAVEGIASQVQHHCRTTSTCMY